jgi:hypothetical protein
MTLIGSLRFSSRFGSDTRGPEMYQQFTPWISLTWPGSRSVTPKRGAARILTAEYECRLKHGFDYFK